jgi:nicotinate-nucleotide--dimethylbenzimidazole phosphoribosyltransferase
MHGMTPDLATFAELIQRPDEDSRAAARDLQARLAKPAGSLGRLEDLAEWLAGAQGACPTRPLERVRVVVLAADHGIAAAGVSAYSPGTTAQMVHAVAAGGAAVNALARRAGAGVRVVDVAVDVADGELPTEAAGHKVRRGSGRIDVEDALSRAEAEQAFLVGVALADEEIDAGADLLVTGALGVGSSTAAAALVGLLTRSDAASVTGRGSGIDDVTWMRKCAAVRDAMRRGRPHLADRLQLLATAGGADLAAMTGFLLQAAARRTPVVLDGLVAAACALVGQRVSFRAVDWWLAGHQSGDPAHEKALDRLSLDPVLSLGVRLGDGTGGLLAVPLLQAAAATLAELAPMEDPDPDPN